jgi:hypothetical protein
MTNDNAKKPELNLFSIDEKQYGKEYKDHLFEQYKLFIDMADKNSERRSKYNSFYLSLISALIAVIGILSQIEKPISTIYFWWVALVSVIGVIFCILWKTNINCYRQLGTAKYTVITEIEKRLPVVAFAKEWEYLCDAKTKSKYEELTLVERWIPLVFALIFVLLLAVSLILANYDYLSNTFSSLKF